MENNENKPQKTCCLSCPQIFTWGWGMVDFTANLPYFNQGLPHYLLSIQLKLIIVILNVQSVLSGVLCYVYIFRRQSGLSHFFDKLLSVK